MGKITKEIRYDDMSFNIVREVNDLKMYINKDCDYCIIADEDDNVLFEINAYDNQGSGFLEDAIK